MTRRLRRPEYHRERLETFRCRAWRLTGLITGLLALGALAEWIR